MVLLPCFCFLTSCVLFQEMPEVNVTWSDSGPRPLDSIHISIAVATDKGLITPIIKDAANKGVQEISANAKVPSTNNKPTAVWRPLR